MCVYFLRSRHDLACSDCARSMSGRQNWAPLPISFPESSFPLTSGPKTRDSGSNHFKRTKEITKFCPSCFTVQSASMGHTWNGCSSQSFFLTAGQGEQRPTLGMRLRPYWKLSYDKSCFLCRKQIIKRQIAHDKLLWPPLILSSRTLGLTFRSKITLWQLFSHLAFTPWGNHQAGFISMKKIRFMRYVISINDLYCAHARFTLRFRDLSFNCQMLL